MRIKIEGEITTDLLAKALNKAFDMAREVGDISFYGANLYLNVYDKNGLRLEIIDKNQPIIVKVKSDEGIVKPALTLEGALIKEQLAQQEKEIKERNELAIKERLERQDEEFKERVEHYKKINAFIKSLNAHTSKLLVNSPSEFLANINMIVCSVWDKEKPTYLHGKQKGTFISKPFFYIENGLLKLKSPNHKTSYTLRNAAFKNSTNELTSVWKYDAWVQVSKQIEQYYLELISQHS